MSQSVLVLGASGYIGQHLVRALSAHSPRRPLAENGR
ncbi:NAD-dependent epimerase/dehydratase family protein, partial [Klebsiella pneumoniae]